jgi:hypothetical protein
LLVGPAALRLFEEWQRATCRINHLA